MRSKDLVTASSFSPPISDRVVGVVDVSSAAADASFGATFDEGGGLDPHPKTVMNTMHANGKDDT